MKRDRCGFSLLELMLVLALLGLLSGLGWNSWQQARLRVERDRACQVLQQLAARQEEWRAWHGAYTDLPQQLGCPDPGCSSGPLSAPRYRITVAIDRRAPEPAFKLIAHPLGAQIDDRCGQLELDQLGAAAASGPAGCCGSALH